MGLTRPLPGEYAEGYAPYLAQAPEGGVLALLEAQLGEVAALYGGLSEAQGGYRLRIGRGDATPLPGFDENSFAAAAAADERPVKDLLADFRAARSASLELFRSLPEAAWAQQGTSNGRALTARCIPYIGLGHVAHHIAVLRERYLPGLK